MNPVEELRVGVLGYGTVGGGTVRILKEQAALLTARTGVNIRLLRIATLPIENDKRGIELGETELTQDVQSITNGDDIDLVVELIGGTKPAFQFVMEAIQSGKHVVTANKALIASHGNELIEAARKQGVELGFEASVAGTIPIIKALRESLAANSIEALYGILNGTCNYILTEMRERNLAFDVVLKEAQEKGYAEADPTFDVDGIDTAHKLAILASMAFGTPLDTDSLYIEGIRHISEVDIDWATSMGYRIKLLAVAKQSKKGIELRVHPTMVPRSSMVGAVEGVFNSVFVEGDYADTTMFYGRGAGERPTASAVVADIIDIARNLKVGVNRRVEPLSYQAEQIKSRPVRGMDDLKGEYYLRFSVEDRPGVLAKITDILGRHGISIQQIHQEGRSKVDAVPLVMVTHKTRERKLQKSLAEIKK
ncbi:MAG: homoserine dehydrogenase, partial [Magnetococcales bacterium]|nr:homoserine dehydrogenase [Magnetococcales bacterium]